MRLEGQHRTVYIKKMKEKIFIILLFFQISSALKILKTPKFPDDKTPPSSFATGCKLFARLWVSPTHKHHAEVLSRKEDSGLLLTFKSDGNYIAIDSYYVRFFQVTLTLYHPCGCFSASHLTIQRTKSKLKKVSN